MQLFGFGFGYRQLNRQGQTVGNGPALLPVNARGIFEGDSITAGSIGPGYTQRVALGLPELRFPIGAQQANSGHTLSNMSAQKESITALNPNIVFFLGGTNDLQTTASSGATLMGSHSACVNHYLTVASKVVVLKVLKRTVGHPNGWDATKEARRIDLNNLIQSTYGANPDVVIVDMESVWNPALHTVDDVHPNNLGAKLIGDAVVAAVRPLLATDSTMLNRYTNSESLFVTNPVTLAPANENPQLAGTAGTKTNATGDVADGWACINNAGLTVVCSKTTLNGRPAQRMLLSGTATATADIFFQNDAAFSATIGDEYEAWADVRIGPNGASPLAGINNVFLTCDSGQTFNRSHYSTVPTDRVDATLSGLYRTYGLAFAGPDTSNTFRAGVRVLSGDVVSAEFVFAAPYLRQVITV
jgi:lysophospholipase L1-like esterase